MRVALLEQTTTDHVILGIPGFTRLTLLEPAARFDHPMRLGISTSD